MLNVGSVQINNRIKYVIGLTRLVCTANFSNTLGDTCRQAHCKMSQITFGMPQRRIQDLLVGDDQGSELRTSDSLYDRSTASGFGGMLPGIIKTIWNGVNLRETNRNRQRGILKWYLRKMGGAMRAVFHPSLASVLYIHVVPTLFYFCGVL